MGKPYHSTVGARRGKKRQITIVPVWREDPDFEQLAKVLINVARRMAEQKPVSSTDSSPPDED